MSKFLTACVYEGTGTAKVSTIDTVTQFVTGTHAPAADSTGWRDVQLLRSLA